MSQLKEYRVLRSKDTNPATDTALRATLDANEAKHADAIPLDMPSAKIHVQKPGGMTDVVTVGSTVWMHPSDARTLLEIGAIEAV